MPCGKASLISLNLPLFKTKNAGKHAEGTGTTRKANSLVKKRKRHESS
jgi:hypothetical protein